MALSWHTVSFSKSYDFALTCVAQLVGSHLANREAAGLIPSQGTSLGCWFDAWLGSVPIDVSLLHQCFSLSLSLPLSSSF